MLLINNNRMIMFTYCSVVSFQLDQVVINSVLFNLLYCLNRLVKIIGRSVLLESNQDGLCSLLQPLILLSISGIGRHSSTMFLFIPPFYQLFLSFFLLILQTLLLLKIKRKASPVSILLPSIMEKNPYMRNNYSIMMSMN